MGNERESEFSRLRLQMANRFEAMTADLPEGFVASFSVVDAENPDKCFTFCNISAVTKAKLNDLQSKLDDALANPVRTEAK